MTRLLLAIIQVALVAGAPRFDVASVKPNKTDSTGIVGAGRISIQTAPGTLSMRNVSLLSCLRWAYDVHDYQITGPDWLGSDRYDVVAKAPGPASDDELKLMLRALLTDRFRLTAHREARELPVFALTVTKNDPRLKTADAGSLSETVPAPGGMTFKRVSMADLAGLLSRMGPIDRPVLDKTGIQGQFDVTLTLVDPALDANAGNGPAGDLKRSARDTGPAMFMDALERIGLRLRPERGSVDFIVIDHAERVPTDD